MITRFFDLAIIVLLALTLAACAGTAVDSAAKQEAAGAPAAPSDEAITVLSDAPTTEAVTEVITAEPPEETIEEPVIETPSETSAPEAAADAPVEAAEEAAVELTEEVTVSSIPRRFRIIPEESQASYEVDEEFFNRDVRFFTAIGVTNEINGQFQANFQGDQIELESGQFTVDLSTLTSDSPRRDRAIRERWLESNTYPLAEFTVTEVRDLPETYTEGEAMMFTVIGDMTIRQVTRPLEFDMTAQVAGDTITGTGTTNLLMKDFGFDPPNILNILTVTDGVTVTMEFTAQEVTGGS